MSIMQLRVIRVPKANSYGNVPEPHTSEEWDPNTQTNPTTAQTNPHKR